MEFKQVRKERKMATKGKDDHHRHDDDHNNDHHGKKEYASKLPDRKYGYFRDDQITFLVTHDNEISNKKQLQAFAAGINDKLKGLDSEIVKKKPQIILSQIEAISFPGMTPQEIEQS